MAMITDILLDTLLDVARLVPFLFLTYLLMEWMEHTTDGAFESFLEKHRKSAPIFASLFGLVPECGFSSAAGNLYTTGVISAGTMIAVFLSTSDEMVPILVSSQVQPMVIFRILAVKFVTACIAGLLADRFSIHRRADIESFCERENCECDDGIFKSALKHTLRIVFWLFVLTFFINGFMELFGEEALRSFVIAHEKSGVMIILCTLIGLIPSCASSVLLSKLYLEGIISFAAVNAGLLANAGLGLMVLFRVNPDWKNNLKIVLYIVAVSIITGFLLNILFPGLV